MFSGLVGTPFEQLNCAQLVIEVYRRYEIDLPQYEFDDIAISTAMAMQRAGMIDNITDNDWTHIEEPLIPCLIVLRGHSGYNDHLGVYIGNGRFLHSDRRMGVITNSITDSAWRNRIAGYYKFKRN